MINLLRILEQIDIITDPNWPLLNSSLSLLSSKIEIKKSKQIIVNLKDDQIKKLIRVYTTLYHANQQFSSRLLQAFYQVLQIYSKNNIKKDVCNDFSISFINMQAFDYLKNQQLIEAQLCLHKAKSYLKQGVQVDPILISLCMNNLSIIFMHNKRYKQAFMTSYSILQKLQINFKKLRELKSQRIKQQVVPLVNTYLILRDSLKGYLRNHHINDKIEKQYLKYLENFHQRGYRLSLKYLGKQSLFSKVYSRYSKKIKSYKQIKDIPIIYKQTDLNHSDLFQNLFQAIQKKMNPRIQEIMNLLMNRQPPIHQVEKQAQVSKIEQMPQKISGGQILHQIQHRIQDEQQTIINAKLFKSTKYKFGKLKVQLLKKQKMIDQKIIQEDDVMNITKNYNVNNTRPYSLKTQNSSGEQFLKYFLIPFVHIQYNHIQLKKYPTGIQSKKQIPFMGQKCFLVVNYIQQNIFRISIFSPRLNTTVCINVQMPIQQLDSVIEKNQRKLPFRQIEQLLGIGQVTKQRNLEQGIKTVIDSLKIKNLQLFNSKMLERAQLVQKFLKSKKLFSQSRNTIFDQTNYFLKYKMSQEQKACIYCLKNNPKQQVFDIYLENTFQTKASGGNIITKGYAQYKYNRLIHDFGIEFHNLQKLNEKLELFQLILKKYSLQKLDFQLTVQDKEIFSQNAIVQSPIQNRLFKRKHLVRFNLMPVTVTLLTINDDPLGIKVVAYDSLNIIQKGVFLTINKPKWMKVKKEVAKSTKLNSVLLKKLGKFKYKDEFSIITDFYFQEILLKREGFSFLINKLQSNGSEREINFYMMQMGQKNKWNTLEAALNIQQFKKYYDQNIKKKI